MKTIFAFIISALICFSFFASGQVKEKKNELNGKTFSIKLNLTEGKRKGWQWSTDEISFHSGKLQSKVMSTKEKFPLADCAITVESSSPEKTFSFAVTVNNPGGSEIIWKGTVTGNNIEGTAVWTNMKGTQSYSFSGKMKGK